MQAVCRRAGTSLEVNRFKRTYSGITLKETALEKFIHRQNLLLFRKRLAEAHDASAHQVLLKLLADEEAKNVELPSKIPGE